MVVLLKTAALAQPPGWTAPTGMGNNMSITAQINLDELEENGTDNILAAFIDNEVRGVASNPTVLSNGQARYSLTVHSNSVIGDTIIFKVYLSDTDNVHHALEDTIFVKNGILGDIFNPYSINISSDEDFPISLSPIPSDSTLTSYPFQSVQLDDYLISLDNDPLNWSVSNNAYFTTNIDADNLLTVVPIDPNWTGTANIEVTATESGTQNAYSASQPITFTVEENYASPDFGNLPLQFVQGNLPAPSGDLNEYLSFDGPCTDYTFDLNFPLGDSPPPDWETPGSNSGTMSLVVEVAFGGKAFTGMSNQLAGFIDGEIAGVANPQISDGRVLYFLSLSNIDTGEIEFRYYDSENIFYYLQMSGINFVPNGEHGSAASPHKLDLAPISIDLLPSGEWSSTVVNPNWNGYLIAEFFATDCKYLDKVDSTDVIFAFNQCADQTITLPIGGELCLRADSAAVDVIWYKNGNEIWESHYYSAVDTGVFHFEALTPTNCPSIKGCPILVTEVPGFNNPVGTSPPLPTSWPPPPYCGSLNYTDIQTGGTCCPPTHVMYVNTNTPWDHDGSTWGKAFANLQDALTQANKCPSVTEIWVAEGTYFPTQNGDRSASFQLINRLTIYGGFSGIESSLSERNMYSNLSILSGDIGSPGDSTDNSYHVIYHNGGGIDSTAIIDGFTITNGNADGLDDDEKGGGIYAQNASPTIRNCIITANAAKFGGGGLFTQSNDVHVDSCLFINNNAPSGGAALNSENATTHFRACLFKENRATVSGAAINNNLAATSFISCLFDSNTTTGNGAGIYNTDTSPDIINCVFIANKAIEGAGIYNQAAASPATINCTFFGNLPGSNGGTIRNNTFTSPNISNCILWGNGSEIVSGLPAPTVSYSIVEGGHVGIGNLDIDPMFVDTVDLRTKPCSPAIDAGNNSTNSTLFDFAGNTRIINSKGSNTIDIGAYEMQADLTIPCTWTGNGDNAVWTDALNWSDLFIPDMCRDVIIPTGNNVTVPTGAAAYGKTLDVDVGAEVVTEPTATMDIGN